MILDTAMGAPTTIALGDTTVAELTITGARAIGPAGSALTGLIHAGSQSADLPSWYWVFLVVPAAATVIGGRTAGGAAGGRREAAARGALAGVVYAVLCTIAAWFAAIVLPVFAGTLGASLRLGTDPLRTGALAAIWGITGGALGAMFPVRDGAIRR
jgi:hypothetical protein